ncbi:MULTISPECIES: hypothetical protein [unclassified Streptomyces]|uniref:hypothetical protein n=1 Tax=unclassified Streptomyces TaxID=2593676 RepID=UPI0011E74263|nr:hypothetical protein [Streptomyces sp. sk2.1]
MTPSTGRCSAPVPYAPLGGFPLPPVTTGPVIGGPTRTARVHGAGRGLGAREDVRATVDLATGADALAAGAGKAGTDALAVGVGKAGAGTGRPPRPHRRVP